MPSFKISNSALTQLKRYMYSLKPEKILNFVCNINCYLSFILFSVEREKIIIIAY